MNQFTIFPPRVIIFVTSFFVLAALAVPVSARATRPATIESARFAGPMLIAGSLAPNLAQARRLRPIDAGQQLDVTVTLRTRDEAGLNSLLSDLYNPSSSSYHHFLTTRQFSARFAPNAAVRNTITSWLRSRGLQIVATSGNRLQITARGSSAHLAAAFNTPLYLYRQGTQTFVANSRLVQLPGSIATAVVAVSGLSTVTRQQPAVLAHQTVAQNGGYTPSNIAQLYNLNPLLSAGIDGTGQTIAVVSFADYIEGDIAAYDARFNLSNHVSRVTVKGGGGAGLGSSNGQDEAEADIELTQSVAPNANILVYEASNSSQGATALYNQIVSDNRASVVSISWGGAESTYSASDIAAIHQAFQEGTAQGQTFLAASGDNGAYDEAGSPHGSITNLAVDYPASDPLVTAVGGTTLDSNGTQYVGETAWSDTFDPNNPTGSGGGLSQLFPRPSYQTGPGVDNQYTNGQRQVPDVAANADPSTGYAVYTITGKNGTTDWAVVGGTSASTPVWSAFAVLVSESAGQRLGSFNPVLYSLGQRASTFAKSPFHDVTAGTNLYYSATPGWDFATGWGSFDGAAFVADLRGIPLATPTVTPSPKPTSTPLPTATPKPTAIPPSISIKQVVLLHTLSGKTVKTSSLKIGETGTILIVYQSQHAGSLQTSGTIVVRQNGQAVATITLKKTTYGGKPALSGSVHFTSNKRAGTLQAHITLKLGSISAALNQPIRLVAKP